MNCMTREEEIKQAAQAYYPSGSLHEERTVSAFVRGAKWADENQPGMSKMKKDYELAFLLKKRELIKKACEWLEDTDFDMEYWNSEEGFCKRKFIEEFRKVMKE